MDEVERLKRMIATNKEKFSRLSKLVKRQKKMVEDYPEAQFLIDDCMEMAIVLRDLSDVAYQRNYIVTESPSDPPKYEPIKSHIVTDEDYASLQAMRHILDKFNTHSKEDQSDG